MHSSHTHPPDQRGCQVCGQVAAGDTQLDLLASLQAQACQSRHPGAAGATGAPVETAGLRAACSGGGRAPTRACPWLCKRGVSCSGCESAWAGGSGPQAPLDVLSQPQGGKLSIAVLQCCWHCARHHMPAQDAEKARRQQGAHPSEACRGSRKAGCSDRSKGRMCLSSVASTKRLAIATA